MMGKSGKKICVGLFLGAHGVRGQVRLGSYTEDPEAIFDYAPLTDETGDRTFDLTFCGTGKDHYLVSVKGIEDRDAAQALKGTRLFAARAVLPPEEEGEYYYADLIGLDVLDLADCKIGKVENVHDYGAGAFLEIKPAGGKSFMLPFRDAFVPEVDVNKGFIRVELPEDWLKEEKSPNP